MAVAWIVAGIDQAACERGAEIVEDVAEKVGHRHDVVAVRMQVDIGIEGVDDGRFPVHIRGLGGDLHAFIVEEPVRHAENVLLADAVE